MNEFPDRPLAPASPPTQDPPTSSMPVAGPTPAGPTPATPPATPNTPWFNQPQPRRADRNGALVLGVVLVVVGAWLLLRQFFPIFELGRFWPVILVGIGVFFVVSAFWRRSDMTTTARRDRRQAELAQRRDSRKAHHSQPARGRSLMMPLTVGALLVGVARNRGNCPPPPGRAKRRRHQRAGRPDGLRAGRRPRHWPRRRAGHGRGLVRLPVPVLPALRDLMGDRR